MIEPVFSLKNIDIIVVGGETQLYSKAEKAQIILKFSARHFGLDKIIQTGWNFQRKQWS